MPIHFSQLYALGSKPASYRPRHTVCHARSSFLMSASDLAYMVGVVASFVWGHRYFANQE